DPRIAGAIYDSLGDADTVVNVGAGAGSYEPHDRFVLAVEPAITMIRQRPTGSAPAVRATAERLPFSDDCFDAALAVLTVHHWTDWRAGLLELRRVSRDRVVVFTWDPDAEISWLSHYFGDLIELDRKRFPPLTALASLLGEAQITPVNVPEDCIDGFLGAYWRRPEEYLNPDVRAAISGFATDRAQVALSRLDQDIKSGVWAQKHGDHLPRGAIDLGYRLITAASRPTNDCSGRATHAAGS
ncbi:MAG: methyltransferase domain-containing protein, partial [Burkholderiales bacterium]